MSAETAPLDGTSTAKRVFEKLIALAAGYRRQVALISLFALLATGADLIQPLIYRNVINDVTGLFVEQDEAPAGTQTTTIAPKEPHGRGSISPRTPEQTFRTLVISAALLFLTSVLGYFFSQRSDYMGAYVASRVEADLILSTFAHVLRLPISFFSRRASAGLAKRINQSDEVSPIIHAFSQQIAPEVIRLFSILAIMLTQNWQMTLVSVVLLPPYLLIARRSALRMKTGLGPYYDMWENISARISDSLGSIKTVKLSGAESREAESLASESRIAYDIYLNRIKTAQRYYIWQSVLSNLSKSMLLAYGGWLVLRHKLTPGDVVMFAAYLDRLFSPIDSLNGLAVGLQQNVASLQRAVGLLESGTPEPAGEPLLPGPGKVEFRDVHFGYTPDREVLKGLTFTLEPGKVTAIAGPSGAGKTTAADLLMRLFSPSSGEIYLDGQPVSKTDASAIRAAIGVVSADGAVFRGTLADNIRYKAPDAPMADAHTAALAAGLGQALERLPEGLQTEIGERGIGLSVGERQRLQIARILVDKPRLLVLDEATANLDYATENEVRAALNSLEPRPTMLIIAHRYTMVKDADHVIVLNEGKVAEQGRPDELIAADGWFAQLAKQSGDTDSDTLKPVVTEEDPEADGE